MTLPSTPEQKAGNAQYLIVQREAMIFLVYALYNTILSIIVTALLISTSLWYFIPIPLAGILFCLVIITYIRKKIIYRIFTSILVVLGSFAAIALIDSIGLVLLVINVVYLCGIASIGKKYDHHFDPLAIMYRRK